MNGNPRYNDIADFKTHRDYLNYMYGDVSGLVTRSVISKEHNGAYNETFNFADRLIFQNRYFGVENVYTSMNTFLTKHKKNDNKSGRKVSNLKRLNALYLDLDCYKIGLSQEDVLNELEKSYFEKKIPVPTFVINSGRGVYLIWKINEDRNALPRWTNVQNYLFEQCKGFNADPKAVDAARILRVPSSINGNNGETVSIMRFNNVKYTLYEIIKKYGIKPKVLNKKPKNEVVYPYGQATARQRKVAEWQSKNFGTALPDFANYQETFEYIRANSEARRKATRTLPEACKSPSIAKTLDGRVNDLFKLFSMRKGVDCCREYALFLCRLWVAERTKDFDYALEQTKALNRSFDVPFNDKYVETRTKSAETILKHGNTYKYSIAKIIDVLSITEAEQQELDYLRKYTKARIEHRKEANRKAYLSRLEKENKLPKAESVNLRREAIALMIVEGKSKADICIELGISKRTFDRDKAFIIAEDLLAQAKAFLQENAGKLKDGIELVTENIINAIETAKHNLIDLKRTVKNAQGCLSPFFKAYYYRRTPYGRSAYSFSKLYSIYSAEQLTWDDVLDGDLWRGENNTS